jgi:hypothetical protein
MILLTGHTYISELDPSRLHSIRLTNSNPASHLIQSTTPSLYRSWCQPSRVWIKKNRALTFCLRHSKSRNNVLPESRCLLTTEVICAFFFYTLPPVHTRHSACFPVQWDVYCHTATQIPAYESHSFATNQHVTRRGRRGDSKLGHPDQTTNFQGNLYKCREPTDKYNGWVPLSLSMELENELNKISSYPKSLEKIWVLVGTSWNL